MEDNLADSPLRENNQRRALVFGSMSGDDYQSTYWPMLRMAVDRLLEGPGPQQQQQQSGPAIEFEPMYSAAYKCVCQQHSEALYKDLMAHLQNHFRSVAAHLHNEMCDNLLDRYYYVIHRAMYSLDGIIPIFTYLNRVYLVNKLGSDLRTELQKLFCTTVIDPIFDDLMRCVKEMGEMQPLVTAPHVLASLVKNLHKLNPTYAPKYPKIFARYVPGVLPAMKEHELSSYISETQELQETLRQTWLPGPPHSQGLKRGFEGEQTTK